MIRKAEDARLFDWCKGLITFRGYESTPVCRCLHVSTAYVLKEGPSSLTGRLLSVGDVTARVCEGWWERERVKTSGPRELSSPLHQDTVNKSRATYQYKVKQGSPLMICPVCHSNATMLHLPLSSASSGEIQLPKTGPSLG